MCSQISPGLTTHKTTLKVLHQGSATPFNKTCPFLPWSDMPVAGWEGGFIVSLAESARDKQSQSQFRVWWFPALPGCAWTHLLDTPSNCLCQTFLDLHFGARFPFASLSLSSLPYFLERLFWACFLKKLLAGEGSFRTPWTTKQPHPTLPEASKDVCKNPDSRGRCQEVNQERHAVYRPEKSSKFYSDLVVWIVERIQSLPGKRWQSTGSHSERLHP